MRLSLSEALRPRIRRDCRRRVGARIAHALAVAPSAAVELNQRPDTAFLTMFAEIAFISQALVAALAEADALVRAGNFGPELAEVMRHAREVGTMLDEAVERAGGAVDAATREMAKKLTAAVESLEKQVPGNGFLH